MKKERNFMWTFPLFALGALAIYFMLITPTIEKLTETQNTLTQLRSEVDQRAIKTAGREDVARRVEKTESEIASRGEMELEPLLESYAMRAKSFVGDFATEAGLTDVEFSENLKLMLPVMPGKPVPANLHARRLVTISCLGDYAAIVSFILRVEHELPHVSLGALHITSEMQNFDMQRAQIVLEWPAKGGEK